MAKFYCIQCGNGNDYTSTKPNYCNSCGVSLGTLKVPIQKESRLIKVSDDHDYDERFSNTPPVEIEPFTEDEMNSIVVANANQSFNLRDIIKDAKGNLPSVKTLRKRTKK